MRQETERGRESAIVAHDKHPPFNNEREEKNVTLPIVLDGFHTPLALILALSHSLLEIDRQVGGRKKEKNETERGSSSLNI